ncbi:MAG: hypothetical protein K1X66_00510 [Verrucomicrobiae bacterium]|nr:hypothetical protein [Verrucomicrobiae bacterium]
MKKILNVFLLFCVFTLTASAEWRVYKMKDKRSETSRDFLVETKDYNPGTNTYTVIVPGPNYDTNAIFTYRAFGRVASNGGTPTITDPLALTPYATSNMNSKGLVLMNVNPNGSLYPSNEVFVIQNGVVVDTNYWSWAEIELPDAKVKQYRIVYHKNGAFLQDQAPKGSKKIEVFTGADVVGKLPKNKSFAKTLSKRRLGDVKFSQDPDANVPFGLNGTMVTRESLGLQNDYITSITGDGLTRYAYSKKLSNKIADKSGPDAVTALLDEKPIKGATLIQDPVIVPVVLPPFWSEYWYFNTLTNWPGGSIDLTPPFNNGYDNLGGDVDIF